MNKSIYFFNENYEWGGGEKMFMWLSKKLYQEGYDIKYCMLYQNKDIDTTPIPTDYLNFKFYKSYLCRNLWYFVAGTYRIVKYIKKNHVEYVVCFGFNSFYILGFLKHFMGFKLLVSERGDPSRKRLSSLRKKLFEGCDGTVFQTEGAKRFYDRIKEEQAFVIPNPVYLPDEVWEDNSKEKIVISVGRIDFEQKRQDLLIKAFKLVTDELPGASLIIVGKGFDADRLRKMVGEYELEKKVDMVGFKKDIVYELKKANVFVLTSDFEGVPNSLLEAMAFGMPVVSTDCSPGGAAFLIKNKENGVLVSRGNENALSKAIICLLKDSELRKALGREARKSMSRFDEVKIIVLWKDAINKSFNLHLS